VVFASVAALRARGWRVIVTIPQQDVSLASLWDDGAPVVVCPTPVVPKESRAPARLVGVFLTTVRSVAPGFRLLRRHRPDVVYVSTRALPLWRVLARVCGRPVVCDVPISGLADAIDEQLRVAGARGTGRRPRFLRRIAA
jgi:hypothetical protein